jgi:hypothetical protein
VLAQRELYPGKWHKAFVMLPALLAVGVALTVINTRAVFEAILGVQTSFVRTPKYALGNKQSRIETMQYRRKSGLLPFIEIGIGTYFLFMVLFAIEVYNFFSLPFLLLFVAGYYWAGFGTLIQEYRDRMRMARRRELAVEAARS